jgi:hypothetical protein
MALVASLAGLLWARGEGARDLVTVRGDTAEVYGRGLYEDDSLFIGAGNRGTDFVVLVLGVPILGTASMLFRLGSTRATLLLAGTLVFFLYVYASYALGIAYNELFLVYVALFSASFYGFILLYGSANLEELGQRFQPGLPGRSLSFFMFASGVVTLIVWLLPLVSALLEHRTPDRLDLYTTKTTEALDLALIMPATFVTGLLVRRNAPLGYFLASSLLVLEAMLAPLIIAQTISQLDAGISFPAEQVIGPIIGFSLLALAALWFLWRILGGISDEPLTRISGETNV